MTRTRVRYSCESCGAVSPKWLGRCAECGEWGTLAEEAAPVAGGVSGRGSMGSSVPRAFVTPSTHVMPLAEIGSSGTAMWPTNVGELDRVLGGGLVPGSVTLVGGEPGIGKSTLVLQALAQLATHGARCLLVAGEESPE